MRAWVVEELGRPQWRQDHPEPELVDGTVLIDVEVAAPNFADSLQLVGTYQDKPALPFVPGIEFAGTIRSVGAGATLAPGDRVVAMPDPGWGAWAEVARAPLHNVTRIPDRIGAAEAVAVHVNAQTLAAALDAVPQSVAVNAERAGGTVPPAAMA